MRYLSSISLALIVHVLLSIGVLMALACTATPETAAPTPTSTQAPRIPIGESDSWKLIAETAKKILDESLPGQHINKGVDYAKAGNYEMAAQEFTKAIELDPSLPRPTLKPR